MKFEATPPLTRHVCRFDQRSCEAAAFRSAYCSEEEKRREKKKRARKREIKDLKRSVTPLKLMKSFVKYFNKRRREHRAVGYEERVSVPVVVGLVLNREGAESRGKLTKAAVKKSLAELEEPLSEIGWRVKEVEYYYRGNGHKVLVTLEAVEWSYSVEDYSDPYSSTST